MNIKQSYTYFKCLSRVAFFLCMMCYLQLHNTRLSAIFMCFSFFFVCGKFGKQISEV
jgi:hypothetical protein